MKSVYINSVGSISVQKTYESNNFLEEIVEYNDTVIPAQDPNYKDYIPPAAARRMAKGIKMGIVASKMALQDASLEQVDAIITGTGMGCLRDSEKFLSNILDNDEQYLTPTPFIQSTHNTVGGQIALELQCKGYNFTYVHGSNSFESCLIDAKLQLEQNEAQNILVGGVDEIGEHTVKLLKLVGQIKTEPVNSSELLLSNTKGVVFSEGANFFVFSNQQQASSYAEIVGVDIFNTLPIESVSNTAESFLKDHNLSVNDVDLVILGNNGDVRFDDFYNTLTSGIFKETQQAYYKHLSGEFHTASSFGFWLAANILKAQSLPKVVKLNDKNTSQFKNILLYNQFCGENHSFTLLRKC
ncbi:beta-ketoacyl synthase N-terminal-like domain-containing protein [Hanstruepera marina]|uniref:beta-ketoacyl synthase N-terminal-like domain-containing protein n=1 Tax=Hanstruepera marina TaxID=2873265 RepID=UPI001CA79D5C|nr:beta-ketoacyl synthase N-terminal-like domain-containing protein [Hanstruepera marina]